MCYKQFVVCITINKHLFSNDVLMITFCVSTLDNVDDEAIQEEEHMSMPKTTMISSTNEVGNEHSTIVFY